MKKLKLKALNLGASEVLTREQLKNVLGGDASGGGGGGASCVITYSGSQSYLFTTVTCPGASIQANNYCVWLIQQRGGGRCQYNCGC